jgi:hypothetical protein
MARLVVDLTTGEHQYLKAQSLLSGKSLKSFVKAHLFRVPNAETLEAIEDVEANSNLIEYESVGRLFADWDV